MVPGTNMWIGTGVYMDDLHEAMVDTVIKLGTVVLIILTFLSVLAYALARSIAGPLRRLEARMRALADGDSDAEVPEQSAGDEVGRMARAVEVFRSNAVELRRVAAAQEEAEKRVQEERRAALDSLSDAFGSAVAAAVDGDFSARMDQRFDDQVLNDLAERMNALLSAMEIGFDELRDVSAGLADGDLSRRMVRAHQGAFTGLQTDLNGALDKMSDLINRVQTTARAMSESCAIIATGARDLSARTESQASSLEETAASMEEMSATVKQNASRAKEAHDLAADAQERNGRGGEIVDKAVAAMARIEASSRKVSDIISVIDGIAFQT